MKSRLIIFLVFLIFSIGTRAQEADQRIGNLINQADWFTLDEEYPKLEKEMQSVMLKKLAEALINMYFNNPNKALVLIDSLVAHHQDDLGFEATSNMVAVKSQILGEQGRYAESADNVIDFLNQIKSFSQVDNFPAHVAIAKLYNEIRNEKAPEIIRSNGNTEIPMYIEKARKGVLMFIPVTIRGKIYRFIFDTGANSTFVSERFANEIGLRIVRDSFTITGVETANGKSGTIDSLIIGDIIFKHPIIIIAPPNPAVDTIYQLDAVLGMDFIRRIGETQIFPKEGKILFPKEQTKLPETGRNLLISNMHPYLKTFSNNQRLIFHFDSGDSRAGLYFPYYQKNKNDIEKHGIKDTIRLSGFGGIRIVEGYILPQIPLQIGGTNAELTNINVSTESLTNVQKQEDGSLGMDFIQLFQKVTINFDKMFVNVEK